MFHELESCDDFIEAFFLMQPNSLATCYELMDKELDWDVGWIWAQDNDKYLYYYLTERFRKTNWECLWEVIVDAWTEWRSKIYEQHINEMIEVLACRILLDEYEMEYVDPVKMEALLKEANEEWTMVEWKQSIDNLKLGGQ
jgi:hypothetical protein